MNYGLMESSKKIKVIQLESNDLADVGLHVQHNLKT